MLGYEEEARVLREAGEVWSGVLRPDSHIVLGAGQTTLLLAGVETARELTGTKWDGAGVLIDINQHLAERGTGARILAPSDEQAIGRSALAGVEASFDHLRNTRTMGDTHFRLSTRHDDANVAVVVQNESADHLTSVEVLPPPLAMADIPPSRSLVHDIASLEAWIGARRSEIWQARQWADEQPAAAVSALREKLLYQWYRAMPEDYEAGAVSQYSFNQQLHARATRHVRVGNWYYGQANDGIDYNYPVCRLYVNGVPALLPSLFDRLVHGLEDQDIDAQVKMTVDAKAAQTRSDGLVTYFHPYDAQAVIDVVTDEDLIPDAQLRPVIPRLTAQIHRARGQIMPGVSFAQSPAGLRSFGESRVGLAAGAILAGAETADELVVALHMPMALHRWNINPVNPAFGRYVRGLDAVLERL